MEITNSIKEALKIFPYKMEARLYGSEARGDARPDSDIDLLIFVDQPTVTGKDEDAIFAPLYQVELQSGVLINPLIVVSPLLCIFATAIHGSSTDQINKAIAPKSDGSYGWGSKRPEGHKGSCLASVSYRRRAVILSANSPI